MCVAIILKQASDDGRNRGRKLSNFITRHEMARNDHSGYPVKWFKDQNTARQFYECVICLEVVKDAVQVRDCGHQFCALCIDDILK